MPTVVERGVGFSAPSASVYVCMYVCSHFTVEIA